MAELRESRLLAHAVRRHARGSVLRNAQRLVKARISATKPDLTVELLANDITVESDHLLLGSWARYFDSRWGLSVGDTVLMTRLDDGDWFITDVISQEDFNVGDHPESIVLTALNTGSGHTVATIPYLDETGTEIGVLVVYDPATLRNFLGHDTVSGNTVAPS